VVSIDSSGETAFLQYLSFKPELIRLIERLVGFKTQNLEIPKSTWPGDRIVTEKVPVWYPHPREVFRRMFPRIPAVLAKQAFRLLNFGEDDQLCFLPLISEERTIGALPIWGADLKPSDNPILSVFANQVSTAMKNARLFDQAQKEIVERTQAEAIIRQALDEKEILLKEVHHRVKNNLQVISSLLNLQKAQTRDAPTISGLQECQNRVRVMALIHEKLYQSENLAQVDFSTYLRSLTDHLARTYPVNSRIASIQVQAEEIALDLDTAIPCGLIVNELVSNSLKYAFPDGKPGRIDVSFRARQEGNYSLAVGDDGVGLPPGLDARNCPSLGLKLVALLVQQINGDLKITGAPGSRFEILFPKSQSAKIAAGRS
jgi:two-component sensor histidine kinase